MHVTVCVTVRSFALLNTHGIEYQPLAIISAVAMNVQAGHVLLFLLDKHQGVE